MKFQNLLKAVLYGILATIVLNLVLYFIARATGIISDVPQANGNSMGLVSVIVYSSAIPVIASAIVLMLLYKIFNNPLLIFKIVGGVALLFSVGSTIAQADTTAGLKIITILMFLVPAGAVGYFLLGLFDKVSPVKAT